MENRKIISDQKDYVFTPSKRKKIKTALVLTGGGTLQTFFSMGAVACLVDNGLFEFDLISAISGGTILMTFIDLCTNPFFNYASKPNWYNQYVRKNIYFLTKSKFLAYFIKSKFDLVKTKNYIFNNIPDFNQTMTSENTNLLCEYNYIDANIRKTTCDHTDIIDLKNGVKKDYWYVIRPARCGLPFTNFNNKPTYDAGNVGNIPVTTLLTRYKPKRIIIVKVQSKLIYDKYPDLSNLDLLNNWLFNNMYASEESLEDMIDLSITPNHKNIFCSISNSLNKSKDPIHKGLFDNIRLDYDFFLQFYNGFLYTNEDVLKIIENEGYIQMYHCLKKTKEAKVFKIPNPDVYNKDASKKLAEWKSQNAIFELFKDVVNTKV
jgi:predicted patatin/cPLA2 family phospholipase